MNYAGDVSPEQCWQAMQGNGTSAYLIDVRTIPELMFVGTVETAPAMHPVILQEWQIYPSMQINENYSAELSSRLDDLGADQGSTLYFLCRSGVRSMSAASAMTAAGYEKCFNILDGFEGDADEHGHRGQVNGWKAVGLPWRQS